MEADWAAEVGAELPNMNAEWSGFVDLRADLKQVVDIAEAAAEPALRAALVELHGAVSPVFTV